MLTLADILTPRRVDLALASDHPEEGIEQLARRLQGAPGMEDWEGFHRALRLGGKPIGGESLLSHIRTDHVSTMLLAAGRLPVRRLEGESAPGKPETPSVHLLFLIAVPMTLAADYLRIVGALARSLRNPAVVTALRATDSAQEFVHILCAEAEEM